MSSVIFSADDLKILLQQIKILALLDYRLKILVTNWN